MTSLHAVTRISLIAAILVAGLLSAPAMAQEIRYSYLDMSYMAQDVGESGSQMPVPGQTVDYDASDGAGIKFRGSVGTWHNMYLFIDYASTDIDLTAFIVSPLVPQGEVAADEFDLTTIRGGIGLKYSIANVTDLYAELSYDSVDFDFGSFALENFDTLEKDIGGTLGVRRLMNDDFEVRAWARYSNVADVDLNTLFYDSDTLVGAGFSWQMIRGFSIVADYETGKSDSWSFGFRLDLDERQ